MWRAVVWALLSAGWTATCGATQYALLTGVGHYAVGEGRNDLEGPGYDVAALQRLLISRYGYAKANMVVLLDSQATRGAILGGLRDMVARAGPGDRLLFYFSGHGTSAFDRNMQSLAAGIGPDSGALVPYDVSAESAEKALASIIVGRRDLRPILEKLNPEARIWVVLDSCYSEDAAKALDGAWEGRSRQINLVGLVRTRDRSQSGGAGAGRSAAPVPASHPEPYPYRNVVCFTAASRDEKAEDIDRRALDAGRHTVDGQPHGAFTSAFLAALESRSGLGTGPATYEEVFLATRRYLDEAARQTPHLLAPAGPVAQEVVLTAAGGMETPAQEPQPVAVKLELENDSLRQKIVSLRGVRAADGRFDLLVRERDGMVELYHRNLTLIRRYAVSETPQLLQRIAAQADIDRLARARCAHQDFGLRVEPMAVDPDGKPVAEEGADFVLHQAVAVTAETGKAAWLVVLNIDADGMASVLYRTADRNGPFAPGEPRIIARTHVRPPLGPEYLKAFAFLERPEGFGELACGPSACPAVAPGSEGYRRLVAMPGKEKTGCAEALARLFTTE